MNAENKESSDYAAGRKRGFREGLIGATLACTFGMFAYNFAVDTANKVTHEPQTIEKISGQSVIQAPSP